MSVYEGHGVTLHHGDCLDVLRSLPDASVDSVVTDPPYGLEFMGKDWDKFDRGPAKFRSAKDSDARRRAEGGGIARGSMPDAYRAGAPFQQWCEAWATECLRVLKPGGHLLAFGGTRTWHRLACAVEDAGFEVRDSIAWMYGSGFPKSLDVSKAIDKAAGAEREVVGVKWAERYPNGPGGNTFTVGEGPDGTRVGPEPLTAPATPDAERWQGWGTALKPAFEPIVVARKPLAGTVAANVLEHGTGALNIDACRVATGDALPVAGGARVSDNEVYGKGLGVSSGRSAELGGRWPTNVVLDDTQAAVLDEMSGETRDGVAVNRNRTPDNDRATYSAYQFGNARGGDVGYGGQGGASRFFPTFRYEAKAPKRERPRYTRPMLRLRGDLTPAQVDHVRARLAEAGVQVD